MSERLNFLDALHRRLFLWLERDGEHRIGWQQIEGGRIAVTTDIGHERTENQDRIVALRSGTAHGSEHLLIVVCDGMGGMQDGRICASVAASGVVVAFMRFSNLLIEARLEEAARLANHCVYLNYGGRGGATLSAVCASNSGEITGLNVGDSRIYSFAAGRLTPLSIDDTIAGQIGSRRSDRDAHSLLQFIGIGPDIEPHVLAVPSNTERLIVTTDGVHFMPREAMDLLVARASTATEASRRLVQAAQWMGSRDNATAACVDLPPQFRVPNVDRSVRIWDPWGELHLLAPPEPRPAELGGEAPALAADRAKAANQKQSSAVGKQTRHGRGASRKSQRERGKNAALLPIQPSVDKPQAEIEIIEISKDIT